MPFHDYIDIENFSRRQFLGGTAYLCAASLLPLQLPVPVSPGRGYYITHREKLLADFDSLCKGARSWLEASCGAAEAAEITSAARKEFESLLPGIPDIGGEQNMDLMFLVQAAQYAAFYRPMKERGMDAAQTGRMIYDLCEGYFSSLPEGQKKTDCTRLFSPQYLEELEQWCQWTQKRRYPANWVARFVKGDGVTFDYGYDMDECAICKYFKAINVYELQPYYCMADFPRSRALGTGLARTKAIGYGDECCNFRYKRGRPVIQDWETESRRLTVGHHIK